MEEIRSDIDGPGDLAGRTVAAVADTPGAADLRDHGVGPVLYGTVDETYEALRAGDVDAIVYDAPVLQHYTSRSGGGELVVTGPVFEEFSYGFGTAHDGNLRDQIDIALLELIESGVSATLYQHWFGVTD